MAIGNAPQYRDFGGEQLGITLTNLFNPNKHLEANSFSSIAKPEGVWLGIMNYLEMYEDNYQPLISMAELTKNTIEIDGNQQSFLYGVPYKLGCPFIMDVLCENSKLGYGGSTFHVIISENLYTYGDLLMTHKRHGKGFIVVGSKEAGDDAKIIPTNGGFRYLLKMASGNDIDYADHSEFKVGLEIERVDFVGGDEFTTESTSYTGNLLSNGSNRYGMHMHQFNVGVSDLSLSYLITADASLKNLEIKSTLPQLVGMPQEASTEIINFFSKEDFDAKGTKLNTVSAWIPKFMVKLAKELKDLQETKLMYSPGAIFSNGREIRNRGMGLYPQIKAKGNHFYYNSPAQAFDLIKQMLSALYSDRHHIAIEDRYIDIELGEAIFERVQPMFKSYYESDNKIIFTGEHDALKGVLKQDPNNAQGLMYNPKYFTSVFYPNFGHIKIKKNMRLSLLDNNRKDTNYVNEYPESAWMILIKDVTDNSFTGANFKASGIKVPNGAGNMLYIKKKGVPDSMEYTIGSGYISPALLAAVGANGSNPGTRDTSFNGLKVTFRTHGEVFLQDASRMVIAEYDPDGEKENKERFTSKVSLF